MRSTIYIFLSALFFLFSINAVYALSFSDKDLTRPMINNNGQKKGNIKALKLDPPMEAYGASVFESMTTTRALIKGNSAWHGVGPTNDFQGLKGWQRTWDWITGFEQFRGKSAFGHGRGYRGAGLIKLDNEILTAESAPAPVPEPSTMILLGTGILALAGVGRKRSKRNSMS